MNFNVNDIIGGERDIIRVKCYKLLILIVKWKLMDIFNLGS